MFGYEPDRKREMGTKNDILLIGRNKLLFWQKGHMMTLIQENLSTCWWIKRIQCWFRAVPPDFCAAPSCGSEANYDIRVHYKRKRRIFAVEQLVTPFIADALGRSSLCSLRGTQKKMSQQRKSWLKVAKESVIISNIVAITDFFTLTTTHRQQLAPDYCNGSPVCLCFW